LEQQKPLCLSWTWKKMRTFRSSAWLAIFGPLPGAQPRGLETVPALLAARLSPTVRPAPSPTPGRPQATVLPPRAPTRGTATLPTAPAAQRRLDRLAAPLLAHSNLSEFHSQRRVETLVLVSAKMEVFLRPQLGLPPFTIPTWTKLSPVLASNSTCGVRFCDCKDTSCYYLVCALVCFFVLPIFFLLFQPAKE